MAANIEGSFQCGGLRGLAAAHFSFSREVAPWCSPQVPSGVSFSLTGCKWKMPVPVSHVIFDVDGLLIDTESLFTKIMQAVIDPFGKKFTWEVKSKQMGKKTREAAQVLIDELDLPITVEHYASEVQRLTRELFPDALLLPGAERLVRHLHKHSIPMALASGSNLEEYELKTTNHKELFGLFLHYVLSSSDPDVKNGKPAPDCFLVCAKRFKDSPDPSKCLVFEDAPNGVQGALNAGMQVVWIPDPNMKLGDLEDKATVVLKCLDEFQPEMFGLPPYDS